MNGEIEESVKLLERYIENQNYTGFDPYDALNSTSLNNLNNKFLRVLFTQIFVYSPIDFRPFFHIDKGINPKALGLLLSAYCYLYKSGIITRSYFEEVTSKIADLLVDSASEGFSGYCWGFNFHWNDVKRNAKKYTPTLVVSSFVGNGFLDMYEITKKEKYREIAESITKFIINDLHVRTFDTGICFSYSAIDTHVVHNANCLGATFLSRVHAFNNDAKLFEYSKKAIDFSISEQSKNGSWYFQLDPESGKKRNQLDFHQGFIINALYEFICMNKLQDEYYSNSLKKAAAFYKRFQFSPYGRALWRLPFKYPIDIHHQAQGIITFCKIHTFFKKEDYLGFSKRIAEWTIKHMQDPTGYFYYQKWPCVMNRISYMRWGQAWMMLALSVLLHELRKRDE